MLRSILVPALLLAVVAPLAAQTTPFTKIADSATPIPGGSGNFVAFSNMISVNADGDVAFSEADPPVNDGIHFWSSNTGTITRVADVNTAIPEGTGTFTQFSFFGNGIEDDLLAFRGNGSADQTGLYLYDHGIGGAPSRIADTSTLIPNGTGNFNAFTTAYIDDGKFAFIAGFLEEIAPGVSDYTQQGIYLSDAGIVTRIADKTISVPDIGGTYRWSSQVGFDEGNLAFWANVTGGSAPGNIIGGYTPLGGLSTLVTTATPVPGLATPFSVLVGPTDLSGSIAVFDGTYSGGSGIYTVDLENGALTRIVDTSSPVPGGSGNFTQFLSASIDGEVIAFRAKSAGILSGLYLRDEGRLRKVIAAGDLLDGKTVQEVFTTENSLAGGYLAFRAKFTNSSLGIYRLQISELVDAPDRAVSAEATRLQKTIKRLTRQLKKARKAGQRSKVKKLTAKLRKIKKKLRQL